ncbi:MAG: ATP phosphoribosyltransferase regulatory subunit [Pseudomonadota bacterium]
MSAARAYLSGGRIGDDLGRLSAFRAHVASLFAQAGAERVEPETLQPADTLLDLYGEDLRARAYVVNDPVEGELFLRTDFTVPVARLHMEEGADPARYAYDGLVWRRQAPGSARPTEYLQAGIELIGGDRASDEAEVFTLIRDALAGVETTPITGDIGIILAAIASLETSAPRRAALRRHIWRPARFQALLDRYAAPPAPAPARATLLAADEAGRRAAIGDAGKFVGARGREEILARISVLAAEAEVPPLSGEQKAFVEAVIAVKGPSGEALTRLRALAAPPMTPALDAMERRMEALAKRGVAAETLLFDAAFGRTLEYYDGFTFEFRAANPALPPLGGGGRYDALTAVLGRGAGSTAIGAIVRPEAVVATGWRP